MKEVCPKCGRLGYRVIKYVKGSTGARLYACEYFRHHKGRPKWCYLRRRPELDGA